jgi:hypothetical protein
MAERRKWYEGDTAFLIGMIIILAVMAYLKSIGAF